MTNHRFLKGRKGQSAIEYLMTYGWMLLVVAIVGGAIFATVNQQRASCDGEIPATLEPGQNDGFGVAQFGVNDADGAQIVLSNDGAQSVTVTDVNLSSNGDFQVDSTDETLNVGQSVTYTLDEWETADSCLEGSLEVTFDVGELSGQVMSGDIEDEMAYEP